mmetsp:Transcript_562/g.659  ORF Transcript_562/g.659 Transcript_562/m.659 type:complete len:161 (+) Transcript_562:119-601(+)|eukprot:CAMPEP_0197862934 /NCGR_PEP_ID=MMETSP1438-20131217/40050_1 /TAXON_ID=1461541 /ORGANISM="Pterosperma sp., Strain CCMP1384" /LENGTH=160 /DNA_ID=CAMNT_0043480655 /DNA_START=102 /DNA_END=584 /DNA_ORIENTATION=+
MKAPSIILALCFLSVSAFYNLHASALEIDTSIVTAEDFESKVMADAHVWLLLVKSEQNAESLEFESGKFPDLVALLPRKMKVAVVDRSLVSTEFNIRKNHVPQLLLFNSHARVPVAVRAKDATDLQPLVDQVVSGLEENEEAEDGYALKFMLAIGGGDEL